VFKSQLIKSNCKVLRKHRVDTCGASVFEPEHNATVLVAKMCSIYHEHSI
jgi:hypothetical protein